MEPINLVRKAVTPIRLKPLVVAVAGTLSALGMISSAMAFEIGTGNADLKVRWDNTFKYTAAWRLKDPDTQVAQGPSVSMGANPNFDSGDLNFKKGLINNRVDWLSEFDISMNGIGARVSGAAWYDSVYHQDTDYPANLSLPNVIAQSGFPSFLPNNKFSEDTKRMMGQKAEFLDAFVYASGTVGEGQKLSGRAGRYSLLYGETLWMGGNGIAGVQVPIDVIKALTVPNVQFKEIGMPVGQVSGNFQVNANLSIGAYYQYEWRPYRLPAVGSYFSFADIIGSGANLLLVPAGAGPVNRISDLEGSDSGQFGAQVKFKLPGSEVEYGLYAAKYHDKLPILVWSPFDANGATGSLATGGSGTYRAMYAKNIKHFGASFATVVGETNVSGEIGYKRNVPLHGTPGDLIVNGLPNADNDSNTPYAVGNSAHATMSIITLFPATPLWAGASLVAELGFNRLLSVTRNPVNPLTGQGVLNRTHTRDAWGTRMVFQPEYFQVLPGVDVQVPIGLGYGISGRSAVYNFAPEHGGDLSIGLNADYQKTWKAGLNYTHYLGSGYSIGAGGTSATPFDASYGNPHRDRDFISFSAQRTF